jgi:protein-disulfide isomerase
MSTAQSGRSGSMAVILPAVALAFVGLAVGHYAGSRPQAAALPQPARASQPATALQSAAAPSPKADAAAVRDFNPDQRRAIEWIVKDYLINNPEVMMEIQASLEAKMEKLQNERMASAIKENAAELFKNASAPIAGNPKGDVTVIEFFDYNCGYCKKALGGLAQLMEKDRNVKVVLKEFPILSKGSEEAARVALAARNQGKYWEFHRAMLETPGQANEAVALRVAEKVGLDIARLKRDMASPEIKKELDQVRTLAQKMGIQGTPHFLVGERVIPGAPENLGDILAQNVAEVRREGCKVC